ncbi:MAG: hypothetical protein J7M11_04760, partial [Elusimicrobia bacterium]|nr:hypothetical protein [Elusimicrobiota bacterium]
RPAITAARARISQTAKPKRRRSKYCKMIIPLTPQATPQATMQVTMQANREKTKKLLDFCGEPKSREEIQEYLCLKDRKHFRLEVLNPLLEQGLLHPTIPEKLTSPNQKYYSGKQADKK